MFEGQLPFPTTPFLGRGHTTMLPVRRDSISRVHMMEQRDRRFAETIRLSPAIVRVQSDATYNIDADPRYHVIQDNLASRQVRAASIPTLF